MKNKTPLAIVEKQVMSTSNSGLPARALKFHSSSVVRDLHAYGDYPLFAISAAFYSHVERSVGVDKNEQTRMRAVMRLFDCFLSITGRTVEISENTNTIERLLIEFSGAICSEKFYFAKIERRRAVINSLRLVAVKAGFALARQFPPVRSHGLCPELDFRKANFENTRLSTENLTIWRAWPVLGAFACHWPNLLPIYTRHGNEFANDFQLALQRFFDGRRIQAAPVVKEFVKYLGKLDETWTAKCLKSHVRTAKLFADFAVEFVPCSGEKHGYTYISSSWGAFVVFLTSSVFPSHLIAQPHNGLPYVRRKNSANSPKHIRQNLKHGLISEKLISDVPLSASDAEMHELISNRINSDLEVVRSWAERQVIKLSDRHREFERLVALGEVRTIGPIGTNSTTVGTKRTKHNWRANIAATFARRGFETEPIDKIDISSLYGSPTSYVVDLLALPVLGAFLPHMAILIIEHPQITCSFLETITLFDKHGQSAGLLNNDDFWRLDGNKLRKGSAKAQQIISLSDKSLGIVNSVIKLTTPLRNYLLKHGDPNWHLLFLQCGRGFSYPKPVHPPQDSEYLRRNGTLARQFSEQSSCATERLLRLAQRFSLTALRAQKVAANYVLNPDIAKATADLGHDQVNFAMIQRYIPAPILLFFQERWVRMFQASILLEILKDSKHKLRATGFASFDEAHDFLKNHALAIRRDEPAEIDRSLQVNSAAQKVVFGINIDSLTVLVGIRNAVLNATEKCTSLAVDWAGFAGALCRYIDEGRPIREDLVSILKEANKNASALNFNGLVHEK